MKAFDANIELSIIKTVCDSPKRNIVLSKINPEFFGSDHAKEIYARIMIMMGAGKPIPSSDVLKYDEALSEAGRALLNSPLTPLTTEDDIVSALEIMNKYRKARILLNSMTAVIESFKQSDPDIDKAIGSLALSLQSCHSGLTKSEMFTITSDNVDQIMDYIDSELDSVASGFIPTGFREFDRRTGGFRKKQVIALASTPGGGKSAMAAQMAINQYMMGFNVLFVTFEMDEVEVMYRMLSTVTKVDHGDINLKKLSAVQRNHIKNAFREFVTNNGQKNRLTIWPPSREMDMTDIAMEAKATGYDIVYVDYVGLLKSYPKMANWEVLGVHARQAKLQANNLDAAVVLLAQKDTEDDVIKYSQAINQNAHVVWMWDNKKENQESGIIEVKQTKVRNGEVYPFLLQRDFKTMTFKDYNGPAPTFSGDAKKSDGPPKMSEFGK